jgi:hypothetical protein
MYYINQETKITKMNNVKAIRVGDKIMVFVNGQKQTVSRQISPETFNLVCEYISSNQTEKIASIFDNVEQKVSEFLKGYFDVENSAILHEGKRHIFSSLIIRKSTELLSLTDNAKPIYDLANKTILSSENISIKANDFFKNVSKIILTEKGNLIIPSPTIIEEKTNSAVVGRPIILNDKNKIRRAKTTYSILASSEKNIKEVNSYILINPFDIVSFNDFEVFVSRYKVLENFVDNQKGIVKIENEFLFDLSYNLYLKNVK